MLFVMNAGGFIRTGSDNLDKSKPAYEMLNSHEEKRVRAPYMHSYKKDVS